mmetsp:Transcript_29531/g.89349  ORF Transcript_29531/g.89349 Transcript_29531/m.89349 type:complete len:284 (+) Transcript_29531:1148-1999(+)
MPISGPLANPTASGERSLRPLAAASMGKSHQAAAPRQFRQRRTGPIGPCWSTTRQRSHSSNCPRPTCAGRRWPRTAARPSGARDPPRCQRRGCCSGYCCCCSVWTRLRLLTGPRGPSGRSHKGAWCGTPRVRSRQPCPHKPWCPKLRHRRRLSQGSVNGRRASPSAKCRGRRPRPGCSCSARRSSSGHLLRSATASCRASLTSCTAACCRSSSHMCTTEAAPRGWASLGASPAPGTPTIPFACAAGPPPAWMNRPKPAPSRSSAGKCAHEPIQTQRNESEQIP